MTRALTLLLLAFFAACSRGPEVHLLSPDELPSDLYDPAQRPVAERRTERVVLYFVRTDADGVPLVPERLGALAREQETDRPTAEFAVRQLLLPLTAEQRDAGLRTAIPIGTELLGVLVKDGVADVNLTAQFEAAGAEVLHLLRVAQVVWTLTELPDVDAVRFRIHGAPQPVIDEFGTAHDMVSRARYSRLSPRESESAPVAPGIIPSEPEGPGP